MEDRNEDDRGLGSFAGFGNLLEDENISTLRIHRGELQELPEFVGNDEKTATATLPHRFGRLHEEPSESCAGSRP